MTRKIVQGYLVRSDLDSIVEFIEQDSPGSARRFLLSVGETFSMLASSPEMGTLCRFKSPRLANARIRTAKGFRRYVILYRPIEGGIEIIRVLHGSRNLEAILSDT